MNMVPQCDMSRGQNVLSNLKGSSADVFDVSDLVFDPAKMLAEVEAYQAFQSIAQFPIDPCGIDFIAGLPLPVLGFWERPMTESMMDTLGFPDWAEEAVSAYFIARANEARPGRGLVATKEDRAQLQWFMRNPTQSLAQAHRILRWVPDAVGHMRKIEASRRYQIASTVCERPSPVALTAVCSANGTGELPADFELWIWITPDTNNIDDANPDVFMVCASLIQHKTNSGVACGGEIIATLHGQYIPVQTAAIQEEEDLWMVMDEHSRTLCCVWDVIQKSTDAKVETVRNAARNGTGMAICCPWIEVAPDHRGHGLSEVLLKGVVSVCKNASAYLAPLPIQDWDDSSGHHEPSMPVLIDMLECNPITLYVMPIEASEPFTPSPEILEDSLRTYYQVPPTSAAQRRQFALESYGNRVKAALHRRSTLRSHFQRISDAARGYSIIMYDPWNYPEDP